MRLCLRIWRDDHSLVRWQMKQRTGRSDTTPEAERMLIELARATPDARKIDQVFEIIEMVRRFSMSGLRSRHPRATEEELRKRMAALVFDRETVIEVYGWDPKIEGY
jgi:hypothetical protein